MLTGIVKSAFRASHVDRYDPLSVVDRVWNGVAAFGAERFITLVAAVIAPEDGRLTYVNAGHPAGLVWNGGGVKRLDSTGPLVSSAFPSARWERLDERFAEGDQLLLYTDGISEALAGDTDVGEDRMRATIAQHALGGASLLEAILADVDRHRGAHPHRDDLTLVTARVVAQA